MKLVFIGWDNFERPVYDYEGILYYDTDPRAHVPPSIYTKQENEFNGEPCGRITEKCKFYPKRKTW